jgi:hypothetical protein
MLSNEIFGMNFAEQIKLYFVQSGNTNPLEKHNSKMPASCRKPFYQTREQVFRSQVAAKNPRSAAA